MVKYCFLKVEYKFELKYKNSSKKEKAITKFKISPKETLLWKMPILATAEFTDLSVVLFNLLMPHVYPKKVYM